MKIASFHDVFFFFWHISKIRVRGGTPERIIQVPGCVDAWQLGYVSQLRVQTHGLKVLTDAECMPGLTVQIHGGKISRNAGFLFSKSLLLLRWV